MESRGYKAFLIDLDGTLIGRDELISPKVFESVRKVAGKLQVSIASGRESSDVQRFARQLGLTAPQVSDNGALILDASNGAPLWSAPLGPENAERVVSTLSSLNLSIIATHPGGTITDPAKIAAWELTRVSALDLDEDFADELVAQYEPDPDLNVVKVSLPYNGLWAVDFTRIGVDKATAARHVARLLGIEPAQMIAAGDSYNDLPLLQACGLRIAMGDAPIELRDIAHYVAPSVDEDGLAIAIDEFILPRL